MAKSKFDSISQVITKHTFEFCDDSSKDNLMCVICKKIMVNAVLSNVCGCHYCYECISEYTKGEDKFCPGGKEECKDEYISLNENAVINAFLNKRISKLKVKCPNQSCDCSMELIEMENHLRLCTKQPMECPYADIGCMSEDASKDVMDTHLHRDTVTHAQLLIELIKNLKNEVNGLKFEFAKSTTEIAWLKAELLAKEDRISNMEKENQIHEQRQNESIKNLSIIVNNLMRNYDGGFEDTKPLWESDIISHNEELMDNENEIMTLEEQLSQVNSDVEMRIKRMSKEGEGCEQRKEMTDDSKKIDNMTTIVKNEKENISKLIGSAEIVCSKNERQMNKYNKVYPNIDADFVWKFDKFSKRRGRYKWSESFYSNNYKLCLRVFIGSFYDYFWSDYIYLYCYIMKGDYDDNLGWPKNATICLSIVDHISMRTHHSETYQSAFNKPTGDKGGFVGGYFINYSSIKNKPSIVANDSIIVSCVISDH